MLVIIAMVSITPPPVTSMLLGVHIYKTLVGYTDYSHYAIYALSITVAVIITTIALYNIYALNFNIREFIIINFSLPSTDDSYRNSCQVLHRPRCSFQ